MDRNVYLVILKGVLKNLEPHLNAERVSLSTGLNNCLSRQYNTTWKQLQHLTKLCETRFPDAEIYIHIINFSDRLDKEQQSLLRSFNQLIVDKCNYLPEWSSGEICMSTIGHYNF